MNIERVSLVHDIRCDNINLTILAYKLGHNPDAFFLMLRLTANNTLARMLRFLHADASYLGE